MRIIDNLLKMLRALFSPIRDQAGTAAEDRVDEPGTEEESYWDFIDSVSDDVSIYDGADVFLADFDKISRVQQVLLAAHWADAEICNGGFEQFFYNSTGVLAPEAVIAFSELSMPGCSALVLEASGFFGTPYPREREVRINILEKYAEDNPDSPDPFDSLDDRYYDLKDVEAGGFEAAALRYAKDKDK
jgi:hypothetical protein